MGGDWAPDSLLWMIGLEERGSQEKGQASDSSPAVLGSDVHPESWADDGAGGAQRVWEEHGGRAAAESVPAHRGPGAAGRGAPSRIRAPLPAQTGEQEDGMGEGREPQVRRAFSASTLSGSQEASGGGGRVVSREAVSL